MGNAYKLYYENVPSEDRISTRACDLVRDYKARWEHIIKTGEEYWTWPTNEIASILRMRKPDWTKIKVTYIRSGVVFFTYLLDHWGCEHHMESQSAQARMLHPALIELDKLGLGFLRGKHFDTLYGRIKII